MYMYTINHFSKAKHFDISDFSTLYTSIPHVSLKLALTALIQAYRVRNCIYMYLVVNKFGKAY